MWRWAKANVKHVGDYRDERDAFRDQIYKWQQRRRIAGLEAELDALYGIIQAYEHRHNGETHWEGCEESHPICAAYAVLRNLTEEQSP